MITDIPAGDGKNYILFLQCRVGEDANGEKGRGGGREVIKRRQERQEKVFQMAKKPRGGGEQEAAVHISREEIGESHEREGKRTVAVN